VSRLPELPLDELRSGGYLQEANRLFFHRLGLALTIEGDRLYVQDDRADPEGWYFAGDHDLRPHALRVQAEMEQRDPSRRVALGYLVQPAFPDDPAR
jgi:hypothetical protein